MKITSSTITEKEIPAGLKGDTGSDEKIAYIDGLPYNMRDGETILSFIRRNHGYNLVPTLCDAPNLEPFGSCRVCTVDGRLRPMDPPKRKPVVIPRSWPIPIFKPIMIEFRS